MNWKALIPEGKTPVTHGYRKGWIGYVYETPWNLPTMADVLWVYAPPGVELPISPLRYSLSTLQDLSDWKLPSSDGKGGAS
jgi:hypothetical protein